MSDDTTRAGGTDKSWVDPEREGTPKPFDKDDGYSGQQYTRADEAALARANRADDTPRERSVPEHRPPEDPAAFEVPGKSEAR